MSTLTPPQPATVADLYHLPENGTAEIINGELILMPPTGEDPGYAGDEIFVSLREYARRTGHGRAFSDNKGFRVHLPNRSSFSPDAALYTGPPAGMGFLEGAPVLAVEVRRANDYDLQAELEMAQKRADYFAAGTLVVWDVGLLGADVVKSYRADAPDTPAIYRRRDTAEAEPAAPGWKFAMNNLFG